MKKLLFILACGVLLMRATPASAQYYGIRINALALTTGTLNAGAEISLPGKYSLDLPLYWNPLSVGNLQMNFFAVQPGVRLWLYRTFIGPFVSAHAGYASYNVGGSRFGYKGFLAGGGVSVGYT